MSKTPAKRSDGKVPSRRLVVALGAALLVAAAVWFFQRETPVPTHGYRVISTYPHDPEAYCQGLAFSDGLLFESTGRKGRSTVRHVELATGKVTKKVELEATLFGEGLTVFKDRIYQLTWKARRGFIYDRTTLRLLREFSYEGEGWGLTHDGTHLIMSDGTSRIRYLDPESCSLVKTLDVTQGQKPLAKINELEFIRGEIWANLFDSSRMIVRISPETGHVTSMVNLQGILPNADFHSDVDVLNGIAWDSQRDRIFVTGKNWPKLFEIELTPAE